MDAKKVVRMKVGLLKLAERLGNVSEACRLVGYSRESFYRLKRRYEIGGEAALQEISRKKPLLKNRVSPAVERAIVQMAIHQNDWGQVRVENDIRNQRVRISKEGGRGGWLQCGLETKHKRLKVRQALASPKGIAFEGSQPMALNAPGFCRTVPEE